MAEDKFKNTPTGLTAPGTDMFPITPDDDVDLDPPIRWLRVSGLAGNIKVTTRAGNERTLTDIQQYERIQLQIVRVHAAGTTATDIEGYV